VREGEESFGGSGFLRLISSGPGLRQAGAVWCFAAATPILSATGKWFRSLALVWHPLLDLFANLPPLFRGIPGVLAEGMIHSGSICTQRVVPGTFGSTALYFSTHDVCRKSCRRRKPPQRDQGDPWAASI